MICPAILLGNGSRKVCLKAINNQSLHPPISAPLPSVCPSLPAVIPDPGLPLLRLCYRVHGRHTSIPGGREGFRRLHCCLFWRNCFGGARLTCCGWFSSCEQPAPPLLLPAQEMGHCQTLWHDNI